MAYSPIATSEKAAGAIVTESLQKRLRDNPINTATQGPNDLTKRFVEIPPFLRWFGTGQDGPPTFAAGTTTLKSGAIHATTIDFQSGCAVDIVGPFFFFHATTSITITGAVSIAGGLRTETTDDPIEYDASAAATRPIHQYAIGGGGGLGAHGLDPQPIYPIGTLTPSLNRGIANTNGNGIAVIRGMLGNALLGGSQGGKDSTNPNPRAKGGGIIVFTAPTITFNATGVVNASGESPAAAPGPAFMGGSGGAGGGVIVFASQNYTEVAGATTFIGGGVGSAGFLGGSAGVNGGSGRWLNFQF